MPVGFLGPAFPAGDYGYAWEEEAHLGCVMVEDDSIEVPTVIVFDEVLSGIRCLQAPGPHALVLQ